MKILKYFSIVVCLVMSNSTFAQIQFMFQYATVHGRVIPKNSILALDNVYVINQSKNYGTMSARGGFFEITASVGDSLLFSCIGYSPEMVYVTPAMVMKDTLLVVQMKEVVYELEKVYIYPRYTYEQLKHKILTMKVEEDKISNEDLKTPPIGGYKRRHDDNLGDQVGIVGSPITALYNAFSKKEAMKRKYYQLLEEDKIKAAVELRYNRNKVKIITNLPDEFIDDFMEYCNLSNDFVLAIDEYTLLFTVKQKFASYEKSHNTNLNSIKFK